MKYICIKTNDKNAINYLLESLQKLNLDNMYLSHHKFKVFYNIIIFYKGKKDYSFFSSISNILVDFILNFKQSTLLKKIINQEYFYFDIIEKKELLKKAQNILLYDSDKLLKNRELLFNIFYNNLLINKKLYLGGFITFRLKKYISQLKEFIDFSVNQYLMEQEYLEFISLLKVYVNSNHSQIDLVHLIYTDNNPILLDSHNQIINGDLNLSNVKYLSDISFSSCDIILNTLLNILPKKIFIHLVAKNYDEDFIQTLKLIFEERINICKKCDICSIYIS